MPLSLEILNCAFSLYLALAGAPADAVGPFDEAALSQALIRRSPDLVAIRQQLTEATAERNRSQLLPNPQVTGSWATIPIGERNPADLGFWQVPNYNLSVGQLFELGKRPYRQQAAKAALDAAKFNAGDLLRSVFFGVLDTFADQAEAVARRSILERLVQESGETLRLQRARADKGDVAAIEVDRLEVEHLRLQSTLTELEAQREAAIAACGRVAGIPCVGFDSADDARRFLRSTSETDRAARSDDEALHGRPDARAFGSLAEQASAQETLAKNRKIPDPTVSLGYQHDRFIVSGNQQNSLNLSISVPLPVFDRGQSDAERARATRENALATRDAIHSAARETLSRERGRLAVLDRQLLSLEKDAIPRAQAVVGRMEASARRGGASLQDVLLSRRALEELELDRIVAEAARYRSRLRIRRELGLLPQSTLR